MAAADPLKALKVPGTLVWNPTSLAVAHGGTVLGLVRDVAWVYQAHRRLHTAEELRVRVVSAIYGQEEVSLAAALRGLDNDAVEVTAPLSAAGATTGHRVQSGPGRTNDTPNLPHGHHVEVDAAPLLFLPDDTANHPAVVFPLAMPRQLEDPRSLTLDGEYLTLVRFRAIPGANGHAYQIGRLADLASLS